MKSTFSIIFYLKRQVVKKDGTVPVMETDTSPRLCSTRSTVPAETPAMRAMSLMV